MLIVALYQLRDLWSAEVVEQKGVARLDGMSWLTRAVLDVIGLAGDFSIIRF